jgi:hypothetical protein
MRWRNMGQEKEGGPGMGIIRDFVILGGVGGRRMWEYKSREHLTVDKRSPYAVFSASCEVDVKRSRA